MMNVLYDWVPVRTFTALMKSALSGMRAPLLVWDRTLRNTVITTFGEDYAVCSTEFTREGSEKTGRQQQTWVKLPCGWRIVAAQVSIMT